MDRLKNRPDFLKAAKAQKAVTAGLVLQARKREVQGPLRVGFTATKKIGNAVIRNLARRRLKEAARMILAEGGKAGFDYVLVARKTTPKRKFQDILRDLTRALDEIHEV